MYTIKESYINSNFKKYKSYVLSNEEGTSMEIVPERGGMVTGLTMYGKSILYMEEDTLFDEKKSVHGGIPVLFPICGFLKDNKYIADGKEYSMKRHGIGRNYSWKVESKEALNDKASITLKLESSDETLKEFPYKFNIFIKYTVSNEGLSITADIYNKDTKNMPIYMGFHPYFNVTNKENVKFDLSYTSAIDEFKNGFQDGNINILNDETDIAFCYPKNNKAIMRDYGSRLQIELQYDENIKYLVVWAQGKNDFVCIEPWMAYVDAINTGKDLVKLNAEGSLKLCAHISVKKF